MRFPQYAGKSIVKFERLWCRKGDTHCDRVPHFRYINVPRSGRVEEVYVPDALIYGFLLFLAESGEIIYNSEETKYPVVKEEQWAITEFCGYQNWIQEELRKMDLRSSLQPSEKSV